MIPQPTPACLRIICIASVVTILLGFLLLSHNGNTKPWVEHKERDSHLYNVSHQSADDIDRTRTQQEDERNGVYSHNEYIDNADMREDGPKLVVAASGQSPRSPADKTNYASTATKTATTTNENDDHQSHDDPAVTSARKESSKSQQAYYVYEVKNVDKHTVKSNVPQTGSDEENTANNNWDKNKEITDDSTSKSSAQTTSVDTTKTMNDNIDNNNDVEHDHAGPASELAEARKSSVPELAAANRLSTDPDKTIKLQPKPPSTLDTETSARVAQRFADRNQQIQEVCQAWSAESGNMTSGKIKNIVSKVAGLEWCQISKVGTTFMKYLRNSVDTLRGGSRTGKGNKQQRKRFYLVREPYSRLVSGFICKIVLTPLFWSSYGKLIVKNFRAQSREKSEKCGNDVTFPEFIKYFIYSQANLWHRNPHFVPIHQQCNICQQQYDYVGHLETYKEDFSYMLNSVNVSINFDMNHDERELRGKSVGVMKSKKKIEKCEPICSTLSKIWWSFHVRGFISTDMKFPLKDSECSAISGDEFADIAWSAHQESVKTMDKSKQKRNALVKLYLQVPLRDRLKVQEIFRKDFEMFGYNPQPADLFPELAAS